MYKFFTNILVPVNLNRQSSIAVEKTMQIARKFNCNVHLLHIEGRSFFPFMRKSGTGAAKRMRLKLLKDRHSLQLEKGCMIHICVQDGKPENAIADYAAIHQIDLILAQKIPPAFPFSFSDLNINRLAAKTNCPVLSLSDLSFSGIKNIVLPVAGYLPLRRLMLATYLARNFNAAIHLISLTRNDATADSRNQAYLRKTFQLLKENTSLAVKCSTIEGNSIADTTLAYAKRIKADLILANPGAESLLSGPVNRLFAKFLFNQSSIPVITVS